MRKTFSQFLLLSILIAAAACLLFTPGIGGQFILDDKPNIVENYGLHINKLSIDALANAMYSFAPSGYHRILPELTFALDYFRAGLNPAAFKTTNIFLHGLTVLVLISFLHLLLKLAGWNQRRAAIVSLVLALGWAIHPMQVSSVLYVVQRMQTMGTLFLFLSLWAYLKVRESQISGKSAKRFFYLTILMWLLALGCKEDSILLPAYALTLELTVLRFDAQNPRTKAALKYFYSVGTLLALVLYFFVIAPHLWVHDSYPGRSFNSAERLLTQGRVLVMYLGQIIMPLPGNFPFYYDDFRISRSLLDPATTLLALLLIAGLLGLAWKMRHVRPLSALGIFLFFAAHIIASNLLGLELAFEHRNHFALIGILLTICDLLIAALDRLEVSTRNRAILLVLIFAGLGVSTVNRTRTWGDPRKFVETLTAVAPESARAWNAKCGFYYEAFELAGSNSGDPSLDKAISACEEGGKIPYASAALSNVVIFKTIRGDVRTDDWNKYIQRMQSVNPNPENVNTLWVMIGAKSRGVPLDERKLLEAIDVVTRRTPMDYVAFARIGFFILEKTHLQNEAFDYFVMCARLAGRDRRFLGEVYKELEALGYAEWVAKLQDNARHKDQ